ncbi:hypothetical protein PROFUN_08886 [Planoprotostelium fungivorum]|uniref:Uncharacterized protein n=1 Tax=Planoprotostelium fungivorum TaxID=1890364 RepID=A0A2P6NIS2_9EUKA|nr:hypothetical protein PROFUN_08886 [Planoprotostelium fungivorum]
MKQNNIKRPYIISQTLWPSASGGHASRKSYFKAEGVGYFFHVWSDQGAEAPLGLLDKRGQPKINFTPQKC